MFKGCELLPDSAYAAFRVQGLEYERPRVLLFPKPTRDGIIATLLLLLSKP